MSEKETERYKHLKNVSRVGIRPTNSRNVLTRKKTCILCGNDEYLTDDQDILYCR